ncbi:MAG: hypothetical protein AABX53_01190 [Nanoarchaeota archaeon]
MKPKEIEHLGDGRVLYQGRIYEAARAIHQKVAFDPKRWFAHWEQRIAEIKKLKLEYYQIRNIHEDIVHDFLMYGYTKQMVDKHQDINELMVKLKLAFYEAYNNYRDSRRGFWSFFAGLFAGKLIDKLNLPSLDNK